MQFKQENSYKLFAISKCVLRNEGFLPFKKQFNHLLSWFLLVTHRNSTIGNNSGSFVTVTYDELRGDNNAMNITSGIFRAPYAGVFEFMFQGFKVSVFLFFPDYFH